MMRSLDSWTPLVRAITALVLAGLVCLAGGGLLLAALWSVGDPGNTYQLTSVLISAAGGIVLAGYFIPWFTRQDDRFLAATFGLLVGLSSGIYLLGSSPDIVLISLASVLLAVIGSALPHPRLQDSLSNRKPVLRAGNIFETVLYAADLAAARDFYHQILGLELLHSSDQMLTFRCQQGVLLIFDPHQSSLTDRSLPSHGSTGPGHLAFAVPEKDLDDWKNHLEALGVEIEHDHYWPESGRSLYFRDPAGNSLELASPTLWGGWIV